MRLAEGDVQRVAEGYLNASEIISSHNVVEALMFLLGGPAGGAKTGGLLARETTGVADTGPQSCVRKVARSKYI